MTCNPEHLTKLQRFLFVHLCCHNFRWFRRWVGGHWYEKQSLGYALLHQTLIKQPSAYMTDHFEVVTAEEHYA